MKQPKYSAGDLFHVNNGTYDGYFLVTQATIERGITEYDLVRINHQGVQPLTLMGWALDLAHSDFQQVNA